MESWQSESGGDTSGGQKICVCVWAESMERSEKKVLKKCKENRNSMAIHKAKIKMDDSLICRTVSQNNSRKRKA